ncbi:MAG: hypothetical protein ACYSX0_04235 [Planctomycetota bacterium]|jgi:hypothetical protein
MTQRGRHRSPPFSATTLLVASGAVLSVVVAVVALTTGGDKPAPAPSSVPQQPADPHENARNEARWWYEEQFLDYAGRVKTLSGRKIHALFAEAERRGYPGVPGVAWNEKKRRVYRELLEREPDDPDANRAIGRFPLSDYPDFWKVFRRLTDAKVLPAELARFRDAYEPRVRFKPVWRTPALAEEEFARASALLDRFVALEKEFDANPTRRAIFESLARVQMHPLLGEYETVHVEVPPFVLFYASREITPKDASERERVRVKREKERLKGRLESFTAVIRAYLAFFREEWMKPLGLKEFPETQLFFIWVFGDRKSFDEYGLRVGLLHPPGLLGYFNPRDLWIFLYEEEGQQVKVETSLIHELTHRLHWHFSKDQVGKHRNHFLRVGAVWFKEGWAEHICWFKKEGGKYAFGQIAQPRMDALHEFRESKLPMYPLRELVRSESYRGHEEEVQRWLGAQNLWPEDELRQGILNVAYMELLYSESWLFVRFLHEGMGGRYRTGLETFTKAMLGGFLGYRGKRGYPQAHEVFAQVFGLEEEKDWQRIQKEFDDYLEAKLYEIKPSR